MGWLGLLGSFYVFVSVASGPSTSWQIEGENVEAVTDSVFLSSKITADGDCSHEIKRHLFFGRIAMTNLDSVLKSRDITFPTKIHIVKAIVFLVVMYRCESWTIKKVEHGRINAFELWCWRRLLRVPWTTSWSNQSILKEISPEYSLEGLTLKLQYFGHLMSRADSFEKTLMLGKTEDKRKKGQQRMRWLYSITISMDMKLTKLWEIVKERETWHAAAHGVLKSRTRFSNWKTRPGLTHRAGLAHCQNGLGTNISWGKWQGGWTQMACLICEKPVRFWWLAFWGNRTWDRTLKFHYFPLSAPLPTNIWRGIAF